MLVKIIVWINKCLFGGHWNTHTHISHTDTGWLTWGKSKGNGGFKKFSFGAGATGSKGWLHSDLSTVARCVIFPPIGRNGFFPSHTCNILWIPYPRPKLNIWLLCPSHGGLLNHVGLQLWYVFESPEFIVPNCKASSSPASFEMMLNTQKTDPLSSSTHGFSHT